MKTRLFRDRWIEYSLCKPLGRTLFVLGLSLAVLPLGYKATRIAAAGVLGAFQNPTDLRWAIVFDPTNPRLYERLGLTYQASLNASPEESVPWFRKAAALEPGNGLYWEQLGQACEFAGDESCATDSFARALSLNPMVPRIEWLTANDALLVGLPEEAASHFRRLLEIDPEYARVVFATYLRAFGNPQFAGEHILPAHSPPALKLAYVNFLTEQGDFQSASQFWHELISAHMQFDFSLADPYLEKLLTSGRVAEAVQVWMDLERLRILEQGDGAKTDNLVFNAGFERNPLNAGFGWRSQNVRYVAAQFADPSAHQGSRCLRIDFTVPQNQAVEPVYQLVPVAPKRTYILRAWVRSEEITSDSGPRLRIIDPDHPDCLQAATKDAVRVTPWHEVSVRFSTCSQTQLIRLSVWRPRSYDFPNVISGHFWLDDVMLEPVNQSSVRVSMTGNP
jgi:hypothetical protein